MSEKEHPTTIRLTDKTKKQIANLKDKLGLNTASSVISYCVNRVDREETKEATSEKQGNS